MVGRCCHRKGVVENGLIDTRDGYLRIGSIFDITVLCSQCPNILVRFCGALLKTSEVSPNLFQTWSKIWQPVLSLRYAASRAKGSCEGRVGERSAPLCPCSCSQAWVPEGVLSYIFPPQHWQICSPLSKVYADRSHALIWYVRIGCRFLAAIWSGAWQGPGKSQRNCFGPR